MIALNIGIDVAAVAGILWACKWARRKWRPTRAALADGSWAWSNPSSCPACGASFYTGISASNGLRAKCLGDYCDCPECSVGPLPRHERMRVQVDFAGGAHVAQGVRAR
jgi:hypothetical protein